MCPPSYVVYINSLWNWRTYFVCACRPYMHLFIFDIVMRKYSSTQCVCATRVHHLLYFRVWWYFSFSQLLKFRLETAAAPVWNRKTPGLLCCNRLHVHKTKFRRKINKSLKFHSIIDEVMEKKLVLLVGPILCAYCRIIIII